MKINKIKNKKEFLIGMTVGALSLVLLEAILFGGKTAYEAYQDNADSQIVYDEGEDDEEIEASEGVFADNGNPIIKDTYDKYSIEVIPPSGYVIGEDYESAYGIEYYNADQSIRLEYTIENSTADEMQSYYEFEKEIFKTSDDVQYTDVSSTEVTTMEVNGYTVNYLSLSYTYNETEKYTEYCAYVMLDDATEYMCCIYGMTDDVNEDIIKECFNAQLSVTK
ncbi:hypothetical protein C8E03_11051 [Lachnotalea glycerini]|uniref:Uncharacterized protein n=1 Tax=Lachnotalea glycerini TaxID=1763509 RepID=A0A255SLZ4_9FIRM|nr:hypothetical protein [Lachnotalea glycerini]OYP53625.1 hypothetical protein CG709_01935 [Lachnotalea glycerini]PXV87290.1 hypothetical protein C8E03_11051 [Lachnotalea glycerini]RDY28879.1 hypothetical protein CG710_018975 [Lachnotalea glycerini]